MRKSRRNKGQFSIIAALLVSIILVTAVIITYSMIRHNPSQESPKVLTSIGEMNLAVKRILEFTVGYYGSILQVTGNWSYAQQLSSSYLQSGLVDIADSHPQWNPSFKVNFQKVSTRWYMPASYSMGNISVTYSISGLGIEGVNYTTSSLLKVTFLKPVKSGEARFSVTLEGNEPELRLSKENFFFYKYSYSNSTWILVHPDSDPVAFSNGTYVLQIPSGVDQNAYSIQVADPRAITVSAFYSGNSLASGIPQYSYTFTWNQTLYSSLTRDTFAVEALQNGTLRWLGQNLLTNGEPIPLIPVKALHVNETVAGVNCEVPFQVEDWGSNYRVPLGLTSNASVFSSRNMVAFLANHTVQKVTFWWDGRDTAKQTSYAWKNRYFSDNPKASPGILNNGNVKLSVNNFWIQAVVGGTTSTAEFMRVNGNNPVYGADPAYVIYNGSVRDIVQQEAEWSGGISQILYADGFNNTFHQWSTSGSSPYLDDSNSYIYTNTNNYVEGWFSFQNLSNSLTPADAKIQFECYCSGDEYFQFQINDGTTTFGPYNITSLPSSYGWEEYDVSAILNTRQKVNNAKIRVTYKFNTGSASNVYIRRCRLDVVTCPNVYSQIYLTLPAKATYYTYASRLIFVNSSQPRTITDLSAIQLSVSSGSQCTENGTSGGYPRSSTATGLFYNFTSFPNGWAHHWSEFISGSSGAGIMFTNSTNQKLYIFDNAVNKTGALNVASSIEFNPVAQSQYPASFTYPLDVTWHGAVVTFNNDPSNTIYPTSGKFGLWALVEHPPIVAVS